MTSDWEATTTEALIREGVLHIGDGYRAKNSELGDLGLPFVRAANIDGRINLKGAELLNPESVKKAGDKVSRPGDSVFTSTGTVGRFAYVSEGERPFVYSPQLCFWRRLDPTRLNARYLHFWLRGPEAWTQLAYLKGQTDMADYVSLGDQRSMTLTLPSLSEQRRIAGVLGALDDKIEHNQAMSARLAAWLSLAFRQVFGQVLWPAPYAEDGWMGGTLGDEVEIIMGQSPPGSSYSEDAGEGPPLIQGNGDLGIRFPKPTRFTSAPTKRSRPGDVLFTVRAPVGEINIADQEYCLGRGVAALRSDLPVYAEQLIRALAPCVRIRCSVFGLGRGSSLRSRLVARQELPERSANIRGRIKAYAEGVLITSNARGFRSLMPMQCPRSAAINVARARARFPAST